VADLKSAALKSDPTPEADERRLHAQFAAHHSHSDYRTWLARCHEVARDILATYYGGTKLLQPHIAFAATRRSLVEFSPFTGYGAAVQTKIDARLVGVAPAPPEWGIDWGKLGIGRLVDDLVRRAAVRQAVYETRHDAEETWGGYGPKFTSEANRISRGLGIQADVYPHRRDGTPLATHWPHCVRPEGYYDGIGGELEARARGERADGERGAGRETPANLGLWRMILRKLADGQKGADELRDIAIRQVDWLERTRTRKLPTLRRVESGRENPDGSSLNIDTVTIDPAWLVADNGMVAAMVEAITTYRSYVDLPVLADMLEDVGCREQALLVHLRATNIWHTTDCWALRRLRAAMPQQ